LTIPSPTSLFPAYLLLLSSIPPLGADPHLIVDIERAENPVAVDVDFGDWARTRWLRIAPDAPHVPRGPSSQLRDDGASEPAGTPRGVADLSGDFSLQWDENWIYLAARITDNVHDVSGGAPWQWYLKDAVALFLDLPVDGDGPAWISGDHAFVFVADPACPPEGRWWRHGDARGHQEVPAPLSARLAVRLTDRGYDLEAAIPMDVLTRSTSSWQPPFIDRTAGFMFIVTDPDGGSDPFGGQLLYGGENDDDALWSQLRFGPAGSADPPRVEIPPEEAAFEAKLAADRRSLRSFFVVGVNSSTTDADLSLYSGLATEYFQIYLEHRPSKLATRALSMAFAIWGNAGAADEIRRSLQQISGEEDVWDAIMLGFRQAFYLDGRLEEGMALLAELEPRVVPLKSRSSLLFILADYWQSEGEAVRVRRAYEQIIAWRASLWHVQQATYRLHLMDQKAQQRPDERHSHRRR